jgi:hypothetical protein
MADDAEGRKPVQNGAWEARPLRHRGIDMQRVGVAAQPVDQRGLRPRRQIAPDRDQARSEAHAPAAIRA